MDSDGDDEERSVIVPEWSNSLGAVAAQEERSWVSRAAFELRNVVLDVALPPGFEEKKRQCAPPQVRRPIDAQMALVCEAFLARACVTALFRQEQLRPLMNAERAELLASGGVGTTDPHAAPPRAFALTVLIHDTTHCTHRHKLLDAAAHWARCGGDDERAASVCRMTVLANESARAYAESHRLALDHAPRLALTWLADDGEIKSIAAELPHATEAVALLAALVRGAAALFLEAGQEAPAELVRCIDACEDEVRGAYVASLKDATDAFWEPLFWNAPFAPIDTKLDFEHHRTFIKLVPVPQPHRPPPPPEQFALGILVYAEGMHDAARDFCIRAAREEKEGRPAEAPHGLRFPRDADEHALQLHVLQVSAELTSLAGLVSAFGPRAAPGKPVCVYPEASVPRMVYRLLRFDDKFCHGKFVLPVTQKQLDSDNLMEHTPQWEAFEIGVHRYDEAWGVAAKEQAAGGGAEEPSRFRLSKASRPPSREDVLAASLFGVCRSGAARVGDAYAEFQKSGCAAPHVASFLEAAIAECGAEAAVSDALTSMARVIIEHKNQALMLQVKVKRAEEAQERAQSLASRVPRIPSVSATLVPSILAAMGRKPKKGRVIPEPVAGAAVTAVVFAHAFARDAPEDKTEARWGKKNVGELPTFDAISKVVGQIDACPTVLMRLNADGSADFLKARSEGRAAEPITALQAMELNSAPAESGVAFLQFSVNDVKLSPLMRLAQKA